MKKSKIILVWFVSFEWAKRATCHVPSTLPLAKVECHGGCVCVCERDDMGVCAVILYFAVPPGVFIIQCIIQTTHAKKHNTNGACARV